MNNTLNKYIIALYKLPFFSIFSIVFVVKLILAIFLFQNIYETSPSQIQGLMYFNGDAHQYFTAIENFILEGKYYWTNKLGEIFVAHRVPHYGFFYWIFRLLFDEQVSKNLLVVFQFCLEIFSLSFFLRELKKWVSPKIWVTGFALLVLSLWQTYWVFSFLPDSLACSLVILGFSSILNYYRKKGLRLLFFAFFFFWYASIIRPFYIFPTFLIFALISIKERSLNYFIKISLVNLSLVLTLLLPWVFRNYNQTGKLILLQETIYAGYPFSDEEEELRNLIVRLGEDFVMWTPQNAGTYFYNPSIATWKPSNLEFLSNSEQNMLHEIQSIFIDYRADRNSTNSQKLRLAIEDFLETYQTHHAFRYYFYSRFQHIVYYFTGHSGSYFISNNGFFSLFFKIIQVVIYHIGVLLFFLSFIYSIIQNNRNFALLTSYFFVFSLVLFFGFLFGARELRYFISFNFFLISAVLFSTITKPKVNRLKIFE